MQHIFIVYVAFCFLMDYNTINKYLLIKMKYITIHKLRSKLGNKVNLRFCYDAKQN
jgi:hypothetical protein